MDDLDLTFFLSLACQCLESLRPELCGPLRNRSRPGRPARCRMIPAHLGSMGGCSGRSIFRPFADRRPQPVLRPRTSQIGKSWVPGADTRTNVESVPTVGPDGDLTSATRTARGGRPSAPPPALLFSQAANGSGARGKCEFDSCRACRGRVPGRLREGRGGAGGIVCRVRADTPPGFRGLNGWDDLAAVCTRSRWPLHAALSCKIGGVGGHTRSGFQ